MLCDISDDASEAGTLKRQLHVVLKCSSPTGTVRPLDDPVDGYCQPSYMVHRCRVKIAPMFSILLIRPMRVVIVTVHNNCSVKDRARLNKQSQLSGSVTYASWPVSWQTWLLDTAVVFRSVGWWYCRMQCHPLLILSTPHLLLLEKKCSELQAHIACFASL